MLEDLHWADEATLDVFLMIARRIETVPCLLIATYRDEAPTGRLRIVLGELATAHGVDRMRLAGLSRASVEELSEPYGVDAAELHRKTDGNPFFVVEALAAGSDAVPDTVRDAVLARAARLSPEARALLDAVAVTPPSTELWLLRALAPEQEEHLDECLGSGMLRAEGRGVAFRHDLARMAVEEEVAPVRREELHRRALAALADRRTRPGTARAPRRGRGRHGGGPPLRAAGCGTRRGARRPSGGGCAVRAGAPLRRRASCRRARPVARGVLARAAT